MKEPREIINHLSPTDALTILRTLVTSDEQLAQRIAELALAHLSEVDPEEVSTVLFEELDALEVEEVWDRAGETRHGYVEPGEAAEQMIEEVLQPVPTCLDHLRRIDEACFGESGRDDRFAHDFRARWLHLNPGPGDGDVGYINLVSRSDSALPLVTGAVFP